MSTVPFKTITFARENLVLNLQFEKLPNQILGIKTLQEGQVRRITAIRSDGLVREWNDANPLQAVNLV